MRIFARAKLPSLAFKHWWPDDTERGVVVQKATFGFDADGHCDYLAEQPPIVMKDEFTGAINASSPLRESEIAPFKPRTDIFIQAIARPPGGEPLPEWPVSLVIAEKLHYGFTVCGPRQFVREGRYWRLTRPAPIAELPICYENAYGGAAADQHGVMQVHDYNPVGRGFYIDLGDSGDLAIPAPQIGLLPEFITGAPGAMTVCGFGPIGRPWLPRRAHAGTFDDGWKHARHPRMPDDYDFAYWNAAPTGLQVSPHLTGDEIITLTGVHAGAEPLHITLPHVEGAYRLKREGQPVGAPLPMALDTVTLDVVSEERARHRLTLIWRGNFTNPGDVEAVETSLTEIGPEA